MRRFRSCLLAALFVISLAPAGNAAVRRDDGPIGSRDPVTSAIQKIIKQIKRVLLPTTQDDVVTPKP
jgi:hypothetical protein